jgi:hypothetical protein
MVNFLNSYQPTKPAAAAKDSPRKFPGLKPAMVKGMLK